MRKLAFAIVVLTAGTAVWVGASATKRPLETREVRVKSGRSTLNFSPDFLKKNHLVADMKYTSDDEDCPPCAAPAFPVAKSDLTVVVKNADLVRYEGGKISLEGSIKLKGHNRTITARQLTVAANPSSKSGLSVQAETGKGTIVAFDLAKPKGVYQTDTDDLILGDMDLLVSEGLAEELGKPELAGEMVGNFSVWAKSEALDGGGDLELPAPPPAAVGLDLNLATVSSLRMADNPTARVGAYPNGRVGLTLLTTACNPGTVNIPWNAPMQTTHPSIAMNLYRLRNGRFEQVGWSWLKHGFLSTNSGFCGTCQHPGTGALLGLNCSDTYGTGNNQDRMYLGGRDEVNPFTGAWTCQGSWFSNYINDCVRRNPGAVTLDAVDHRLDVLDADLGNANSQYFYEAYYILQNDIDTYNNVASREATFSWSGSAWTIGTINNQIQGPAINRWGDQRSTAQPQTEGDVIVAVKTTDLGAGMWNYEYAVYNHTLDRQVREFILPIPTGASIENIGFHDIDRNAGNDWTATVGATSLKWSTPAPGNPNANPLKYSSVFNFRFNSDVPPASSSVNLTLHKPGALTSLNAVTRGPLTFDAPTSFVVDNSFLFGGTVQSLAQPDDNKVSVGPMDSGSRSGSGIIATIAGPSAAVTQLIIGMQASNTLTNAPVSQVLEAYNWGTSTYEILDTRQATVTDSDVRVTITSNPARFVNSSTREVRLRVRHSTDLGVSGNRWKINIDQLGVHFN